MNAQTRYGLASLLLAALGLIGAVIVGNNSGPWGLELLFAWIVFIGVVGGLVLLIVGLVRRPRAVQPRQD